MRRSLGREPCRSRPCLVDAPEHPPTVDLVGLETIEGRQVEGIDLVLGPLALAAAPAADVALAAADLAAEEAPHRLLAGQLEEAAHALVGGAALELDQLVEAHGQVLILGDLLLRGVDRAHPLLPPLEALLERPRLVEPTRL